MTTQFNKGRKYDVKLCSYDNRSDWFQKVQELATMNDWYMSVAYTVRSRLMNNWIDTLHGMAEKRIKWVGYLSAGICEEVKKASQQLGRDLRQLMDMEEESIHKPLNILPC